MLHLSGAIIRDVVHSLRIVILLRAARKDRVQVIIAPVLVDDILSLIRFNLVFSWPMVSRCSKFVVQRALGSHISQCRRCSWRCEELVAKLDMARGHSPKSKVQDMRLRVPSLQKGFRRFVCQLYSSLHFVVQHVYSARTSLVYNVSL